MNIKECLASYKTITLEIECLKDEILQLRAATEYRSPSFTHTGGTVCRDKTGENTAKIVDAENALLDKISELIDAGNRVRRLIDTVEDSRCRLILSQRYLGCKSWESIAHMQNFDLRWIYRLHNKAIKLLENNGLGEVS